METARELIVQARLLRAKGDNAGALEKYRAAHALAHTPITGVELARTYADLNMPVEARDLCLEVQRMPTNPNETERSVAARNDAATLAESLRSKAASVAIRVTLKPKDPAAELTVTIDGHAVPLEALGQPRRVNPGKHEIKVQVKNGPSETKQIEAAAGTEQDVLVELSLGASSGTTTGGPLIAEAPRTTRMSPLVPIGVSVAGAGILVGAIGGIIAIQSKSELDTNCPGGNCRDEVDIDAQLSRIKGWATVSTIGFGVGLIGGVLAVVGFLNPSTEVTSSRASAVRILPTLGGLRIDGRF